jgi:hypothetical protein
MDFMIQPLETGAELQQQPGTNWVCPGNVYQCGCNTIQGCACPKQIMEP